MVNSLPPVAIRAVFLKPTGIEIRRHFAWVCDSAARAYRFNQQTPSIAGRSIQRFGRQSATLYSPVPPVADAQILFQPGSHQMSHHPQPRQLPQGPQPTGIFQSGLPRIVNRTSDRIRHQTDAPAIMSEMTPLLPCHSRFPPDRKRRFAVPRVITTRFIGDTYVDQRSFA